MSSTERAVREKSSDQSTGDPPAADVEYNGESHTEADVSAQEHHEPSPARRPDPSLLPGQPPIVARSTPAPAPELAPTDEVHVETETETAQPVAAHIGDASQTLPTPTPTTTPEPGPAIAPPVPPPPTAEPAPTAPAPTITPPPETPETIETIPVPELKRAPAHVPFGGGEDSEVSAPPPAVRRTVVDAERHLIAPVTRPVGRRPRVRKVTRVLRHVDPWSVFKIAAVFSLVLYGIVLTSGVLLWNVAYSTGTIDNLEQFFESFGWTDFQFKGGEIYHSAWISGLFGVVAVTGFAVLGATLFNLITDLVGGVRMTVLEEEVVERTDSPMKRFTVRRTGTASSAMAVEERSPER